MMPLVARPYDASPLVGRLARTWLYIHPLTDPQPLRLRTGPAEGPGYIYISLPASAIFPPSPIRPPGIPPACHPQRARVSRASIPHLPPPLQRAKGAHETKSPVGVCLSPHSNSPSPKGGGGGDPGKSARWTASMCVMVAMQCTKARRPVGPGRPKGIDKKKKNSPTVFERGRKLGRRSGGGARTTLI
jgi:hypothetical protein